MIKECSKDIIPDKYKKAKLTNAYCMTVICNKCKNVNCPLYQSDNKIKKVEKTNEI